MYAIVSKSTLSMDAKGILTAECAACGTVTEHVRAGTISADEHACVHCFIGKIESPRWGKPTYRQNEKNGWRIVSIHYSADPDKATQEWLDEEKKQFSADPYKWDQFYEINHDGPSGPRVFSTFSKAVHHDPDIKFDPKFPLIVGWDWGLLHPAATFFQWVANDTIHILCEVLGYDCPINGFVSAVERVLAAEFGEALDIGSIHPEVETLEKLQLSGKLEAYGDPAGSIRNSQGGSDIRFMASRGWMVGFTRTSAEQRIEKLSDRIRLQDDGAPRLYLKGKAYRVGRNESPIPMPSNLLEGFMSGYQWKTDLRGVIRNPPRPDKETKAAIFTHLMDALGEAVFNTWPGFDRKATMTGPKEPGSLKSSWSAPSEGHDGSIFEQLSELYFPQSYA